jgi:hypothetical protein
VNEQCDDQIACTFDACDSALLRCRFTPDASQCQNDIHCDGLEQCDGKLGCVPGEPVTCSDGNPCNIDTCVEADKSCRSEPRDVDGDGDPDAHCGGGDCDDGNAAVASTLPEVCGNGADDDCDGDSDEADCSSPMHDTCLTALDVAQPGNYQLSTAAAALDYAASCGVSNAALARDVVVAALLAAGPPIDLQVTARSSSDVALAVMASCGDAGSEIACNGGFAHPGGGRVSKVRARGVGDAAMASALPVLLFGEGSSTVTLRVEHLPASIRPTNETCGTAAALTPGVPVLASVVDALSDLASVCQPATGELVYAFTLASDADVDLYASSVDGDGLPSISLRAANCALPDDEITCHEAAAAHIYRHGLPAGDYFVSVAASAPTDVWLTLALSPPTPAPVDDDCSGAPLLPHNQTIAVALAGHQDDHDTGCLPGASDAAYQLSLPQASDVLLLARGTAGDQVAAVLASDPCDDTSGLACGKGQQSPVRAQKRNLAAGDYRVLVESAAAQPAELTALVRPASPPLLVPFADECSGALVIPSSGGFLTGNTVNAQAHYAAGCDTGSQSGGGARDQMLRLDLSAEQRVVLDMQGSAFATVLDVREASSCPGQEVPLGCAAGYYPERSYLDLTLAAGSYYLQVDGYAGGSGPWFLDVFVVDP